MKTLAEKQREWEAKQAAKRAREEAKLDRADAYWSGADLLARNAHVEFGPEDCPNCGAPTNNAEGGPCPACQA